MSFKFHSKVSCVENKDLVDSYLTEHGSRDFYQQIAGNRINISINILN